MLAVIIIDAVYADVASMVHQFMMKLQISVSQEA